MFRCKQARAEYWSYAWENWAVRRWCEYHCDVRDLEVSHEGGKLIEMQKALPLKEL